MRLTCAGAADVCIAEKIEKVLIIRTATVRRSRMQIRSKFAAV